MKDGRSTAVCVQLWTGHRGVRRDELAAYGAEMDDYELIDGTSGRPGPPNELVRLREAAREAAGEAAFTYTVMIRPVTTAEERVARELRRTIVALDATWHEAPPLDTRPPLVRRLQGLLGVAPLVQVLLGDKPDDDGIGPDMVEALVAAQTMCAAYEKSLEDLEQYLVDHSATHHDRLPELEQQLHPFTGPDCLWAWSNQAHRVLRYLNAHLLERVLTQRRERGLG